MWVTFASQSYPWLVFLGSAVAWIKISVFLLIWISIWLPIAIPLARRLSWHPPQPFKEEQKLPMLASLYAIAPLVVWGIGHVEGNSWADYGLVWQAELLLSLLTGLTLALGGLLVVFSLESSLGWIRWHPDNLRGLRSIALPLLGLGLWIGVTEELIFRGVFFTQLQQDYGIGIAAVISSLLFALLHLIWEQKETLPQLPGLWLMGVVLVVARLVDGGNLGLAWGLHSGWIWGLASLSATDSMTYTDKMSPWVTGLAGHPLAGLAGISCLLATGAALWIFW